MKYTDNRHLLIAVVKMEDSLAVSKALLSHFLLWGLLGGLPVRVPGTLWTSPRGDQAESCLAPSLWPWPAVYEWSGEIECSSLHDSFQCYSRARSEGKWLMPVLYLQTSVPSRAFPPVCKLGLPSWKMLGKIEQNVKVRTMLLSSLDQRTKISIQGCSLQW